MEAAAEQVTKGIYKIHSIMMKKPETGQEKVLMMAVKMASRYMPQRAAQLLVLFVLVAIALFFLWGMWKGCRRCLIRRSARH